MEETVKKIDIVPAIYLNERKDGNVLLRCLQGKETVDRAFEPNMFKNITNPKYLLLGITTGINYMQLIICDGKEFKNLFHEKWDVLLKD